MNLKNKFLVFPKFAYYTTGYSQGIGRSEFGYYLITPTGTASNGSGVDKPTVPSNGDLIYDIKYIKRFLEGGEKDEIGLKWYYDSVVKYPPRTRLSEIKAI